MGQMRFSTPNGPPRKLGAIPTDLLTEERRGTHAMLDALITQASKLGKVEDKGDTIELTVNPTQDPKVLEHEVYQLLKVAEHYVDSHHPSLAELLKRMRGGLDFQKKELKQKHKDKDPQPDTGGFTPLEYRRIELQNTATRLLDIAKVRAVKLDEPATEGR
jgi:hypothetical protein